MVRTAETVLFKQPIRFADEIAIGEEKQLDQLEIRAFARRRRLGDGQFSLEGLGHDVRRAHQNRR
jgi:hypothetical protein